MQIVLHQVSIVFEQSMERIAPDSQNALVYLEFFVPVTKYNSNDYGEDMLSEVLETIVVEIDSQNSGFGFYLKESSVESEEEQLGLGLVDPIEKTWYNIDK